MENTVTYAKLNNGQWGVRCTSEPKMGGVTVTKKDGTQKYESITKVVWTDGQIWLCSIFSSEDRSAGRRARGNESYGGFESTCGRF